MLKVTNIDVFGWDAAIRGMRNPKESWEKSDSAPCLVLNELTPANYKYRCAGCKNEFDGRPNCIVIGPNDLTLMKKLIAAGSDHSKFMRMIHVQCDWEAPLYWWKEADTYKVATVRNSCSTMHKIMEHPFTPDMFAHEHLWKPDSGSEIAAEFQMWLEDHYEESGMSSSIYSLGETIVELNLLRSFYLDYKNRPTKDIQKHDKNLKEIWWQIIQLLPSSYLQKATMDLNYATLRNMYHSRKAHKQDEWREDFCNWVKSLPYSELITMTREELLESIKEKS